VTASQAGSREERRWYWVEDKRLYLPFYGKRAPPYILVQRGSAYTKLSHKETRKMPS
jgi:hypothetical protein